jgi:hypothetical protein
MNSIHMICERYKNPERHDYVSLFIYIVLFCWIMSVEMNDIMTNELLHTQLETCHL